MKIVRPDREKRTESAQADGRDLNDYYAGFNARLMATTIDIILLVPVILLILEFRTVPEALQLLNAKLATGHGTAADIQEYYLNQGGLRYTLTNTLVDTLIIGTIIVAFWRWLGATPGKKLFGMQIVDETTLQPASATQHLIRFVGYVVSAAVLFIGFIWVAFDKQKQGWHDRLSNTLVLYTVPHDKAWKDRHFKRQTIGVLIVCTLLLVYLVVQSQGQ